MIKWLQVSEECELKTETLIERKREENNDRWDEQARRLQGSPPHHPNELRPLILHIITGIPRLIYRYWLNVTGAWVDDVTAGIPVNRGE